ncbi:2-hydroxyacid dehydrogenase [Sphingomonas piscis]|uniref:2-hydroxyacid dehydrogenase n=2 Tax=Sphingomonas piscis TaxID=2714943 RepID=A0A6G7YTJ7_9SPHN|nr:2-hydroxyacid dehydrogenase [Sphingomonas piscis]
MLPSLMAKLQESFTVHCLWQQADPTGFLADIGPRIRGVTSSFAGPVPGGLLEQFPNLEIIASFGVGYDNVDAAAAAARGVVVTNTPGVLDDEVADLTLGLLLATLRRIPQADRFVRTGQWIEGAFPLSPSLRGRRVGIVGMGNIGRAIAQRLAGFDVEIAYHARSAKPDLTLPYHSSVVALAQASDVLIAIVPGGEETRHLIGAEVLKALGPDGVLINVARGSVVDEQALITALQSGTILAAGLDVYDDEPNVPRALIDMPNVVLLPHVGSASARTRDAMGQLVVDNLVGWFGQGSVLTPVPESEPLLGRGVTR